MENVRKDLAEATDRTKSNHLTLANKVDRQIFKSLAIGSASFFAIVLLGSAISSSILISHNVDPHINAIANLQYEFIDEYLTDRLALAQQEVFAPLLRPINASERTTSSAVNQLLNTSVGWLNSDPSQPETPLVSKGTRSYIMRLEKNWLSGKFFAGKLKARLDIFKHLPVDDGEIWDLELAEPFNLVGLPTHTSQIPSVDALELLTLIKVYALKTIDSKELGDQNSKEILNPITTLRGIRSISRLMMSSENFALVSGGIAALDIERQTYKELLKQKLITETDWVPISNDLTTRAQRTLRATRGYLRFSTSPLLLGEKLKGGQLLVGLCAGLNSQFVFENQFKVALTHSLWPFERDYSKEYANLEQVFLTAGETCRLRYLRKWIKQGGGLTALADLTTDGSIFSFSIWPYFRTVFALRDWVSSDRYFDAYELQHHPKNPNSAKKPASLNSGQ